MAQENETNIDDNNAPNTEVEVDDQNQDQDSDDEQVTLTKEEFEKFKKAQEELETEREKSTRYKAERDRIKGKSKGAKTDDSLIEKAFLNSAGYKSKDEQETIMDLADKLGINVAEAVEDSFVKDRIEHMRKEALTNEATPNSSKKRKSTTDDVQYWIDKGELPPADQVELRRKVVNARQAKAKNATKFNN